MEVRFVCPVLLIVIKNWTSSETLVAFGVSSALVMLRFAAPCTSTPVLALSFATGFPFKSTMLVMVTLFVAFAVADVAVKFSAMRMVWLGVVLMVRFAVALVLSGLLPLKSATWPTLTLLLVRIEGLVVLKVRSICRLAPGIRGFAALTILVKLTSPVVLEAKLKLTLEE